MISCLLIFGNKSLWSQLDRADSLKKIGNYKEALDIYKQRLESDISDKNIKEQGMDYNNIANVYCYMGEYQKSIEYYFKALTILEKDKGAAAVINYNIGSNYQTMRQDSLAFEYINRAINLLFAGNKFDPKLGDCYNVMSGIYQDRNDYRNALHYLKQAEAIFKKNDKKDLLGNVYLNMAYLELERGKYQEVNILGRKALALFKEMNDARGISTSYINLNAANYYLYEDPQHPDFKKEMRKCIALLDSALLALRGIHSPEQISTVFLAKSELYAHIHNGDSAYFYLQKYNTIKDSLFGINTQKQIKELSIQYEVGKKDQENEMLTIKSERRALLAIIAFSGCACLLMVFLLFIIRSRHRKKQKQVEFEKGILEFKQQALRAQMNPHFIFNAINSIQKYILKNNQQEAYDYLAKFAKLIRIVLNNSQEKTLMLQQEIEMIKLYVELEQLRFNNKFDFNLNMDEQVNEMEIVVPAMLIQPYIENAIWHGLMNLDKERKGVLTVDITQNEEVLRICIKDNGIGREQAKQYRKEDAHRSVAMTIIEQRLLMINKMQEYENAKVVITDLRDEKGTVSGTKVEIYLPIHGK